MAVYSLEGCHENCYEGTTVLINNLDIREQNLLDKAEAAIVTARIMDAEKNTVFKNVDFDFYKLLHKNIFGDLYRWAGTVRKINLSKKGSSFCNADEIENIGVSKFRYLKEKNYFCNFNRKDFIEHIADFYNDMNYLHPFREGNGRTLRLFISLLVKNTGYHIDFEKCDGDILMIATIKAFQGDVFLLQNVLDDIIS